jgi:kynurenine formamidase
MKFTALSRLVLAASVFAAVAQAQLPGPAALRIPATDDGLPGAGPIRRYDWFQRLWLEKRTGWAARWADRERYLGTAAKGPEAVKALRFPGLAPEAAKWLVEHRRVKAVGIDTASIDHGPSTLFGAHVTLCTANVPIFENVAALERLPEHGAFIAALPMKIAGGSGGPLRIVARLP